MAEQSKGEIKIIGRAVQRKPIKTPIGEVRSYLPPAVEQGVFEDGTSYSTGDPVRLAWWERFEGDYDGSAVLEEEDRE